MCGTRTTAQHDRCGAIRAEVEGIEQRMNTAPMLEAWERSIDMGVDFMTRIRSTEMNLLKEAPYSRGQVGNSEWRIVENAY